MGEARIEISSRCAVKIVNKGARTRVCYGAGDTEVFEKGDMLHKDWRGKGVEFGYLIDRWLRRLSGEEIPLTDYFKDPMNRLLDQLGLA